MLPPPNRFERVFLACISFVSAIIIPFPPHIVHGLHLLSTAYLTLLGSYQSLLSFNDSCPLAPQHPRRRIACKMQIGIEISQAPCAYAGRRVDGGCVDIHNPNVPCFISSFQMSITAIAHCSYVELWSPSFLSNCSIIMAIKRLVHVRLRVKG